MQIRVIIRVIFYEIRVITYLNDFQKRLKWIHIYMFSLILNELMKLTIEMKQYSDNTMVLLTQKKLCFRKLFVFLKVILHL